MGEKKSCYHLTLYTNINSRWTANINVKAETILLLEENVELCNPGVRKDYINRNESSSHKRKIKNQNILKLKTSVH